MAQSRRTGRPPGRPPLGRSVHQWGPRLEPELDDVLHQGAAMVGISFGSYLRQILADAHGWTDDYLPALEQPLQLALPQDELRRRTDALSADDCWGLPTPGLPRRSITAEQQLGDIVDGRARGLGVPSTDYIRAVLRLALGLADRPDLVQGELLRLPRARGKGVRLAS